MGASPCPAGYTPIYGPGGVLNHCQLPYTDTPDFLAAQNREIAVSLNEGAAGYQAAGIYAATPEVQALPQNVQNAIINAQQLAFNYTTYGIKPPAPYDQFIQSNGAVDMAGLKTYFLKQSTATPGNQPSVTYDPISNQYTAAPVLNIPTVLVPVQQGAIPGDNTKPGVPNPTVTPGTVPADAHPGTMTQGAQLVTVGTGGPVAPATVTTDQQTPILSGSLAPASSLTAWLQANFGRSTATVSEWNWIMVNALKVPGFVPPGVDIGYGDSMVTAADYLDAITKWQSAGAAAPGVTQGGTPATVGGPQITSGNVTPPASPSMLWPLVFIGGVIALWAILHKA